MKLVLDTAPGTLRPVDGNTLDDILRAALHNCAVFDKVSFKRWLATQHGVQALARRRPPDRVYRIITDNERAYVADAVASEVEMPTLHGIVLGYASPGRGEPAMCWIQVLGVLSGNGSNETPIRVPEEALEDVTESLRALFAL